MLGRREFLRGAAGAGALSLTQPWVPLGQSQAGAVTRSALPAPASAPFDHVIVLMFENRSFDHVLGWLPGADGRQAGLTYTDTSGATYPTYQLAPDFQGCGYADPDHSWEGGVKQLNGGKLDGFLRTATPGDTFPIGYYKADGVPILGSLARNYTTLDRYFCSILAETFPNRFYQHAARTDRDHNNGISQTSLSPTIWDRLAAGGLTGRYYSVDEPFIGLWGTKYLSITHPVTDFLTDAASGTLPNVAFVDPSFANEGQGQSGDYHPHGDVRTGESYLAQIYHAVRSSPAWDRTVLVVNFDEWGGFFDHVVPPLAADDTVRAAMTKPGDPHPDYRQLGFRVPCIVISPFSAARIVHDGPYEHTSVLKMIEWRWGLPALTLRDASARNLAEVLDFSLRRTDVPNIASPAFFPSVACGPTSTPASPPAKITASPPGTSPTSPTPSAPTAAPAGSATSGTSGSLPATGTSLPLLGAGAVAVTGGMALRHAARKLAQAEACRPALVDADDERAP